MIDEEQPVLVGQVRRQGSAFRVESDVHGSPRQIQFSTTPRADAGSYS
jgi:hypothetical protein